MKLKLVLAGICAWMTITGIASAQTTRVAYVDINRVTEKSDKINKSMANVQGKVEDLQKEIEAKRKRAIELESEIKKGEGVLAESEISKKRSESAKLKKELDDLQYEGRREMQKLDSTLFEPMVKTIVLAIEDVAKEKNIDLVVRGEAVIYGGNTADITEDVIKKLNSSSYNMDAPAKSSNDNESTGSAKEPDASDKSNSDSGTSDKAESSDKSEKSDKPAPTSSEASKSDDSAAKSIFPTVPLVKRPVDRQSE